MTLFISPHNDDAALFGAFTLLRERPLVVTVLRSFVQPSRGYLAGDAVTRAAEDRAAICGVLGCSLTQLDYRDDQPDWSAIEDNLKVVNGTADVVFAPAIEQDGHPHHNRLGEIAKKIWGSKVVPYMTYTKRGKSTGQPVPFEPAWVGRKLKALTCYESQIALDNCCEHFVRDQREYYQSS